MNLNVTSFEEKDLEAAARHYEEQGFILLNGLDNGVTNQFDEILQDILECSGEEWKRIIDPHVPAKFFSPEVRKRLARIETPDRLKRGLLRALEPIVRRIIGPLAHVSSTFHSQFKAGAAPETGHPGFHDGSEYMELHGPYKLHQDFAGASFPITPSMLTLWVAINTTPSNPLRLYPGSHRQGLLCNEFLGLDDDRLAPLGEPLDIPGRRGTGVLFHGLMLHGTGTRGPGRRISCDIRFFPLCGFLPSEVYFLSSDLFVTLRKGLQRATGSVQQAPLLEALLYLGQPVEEIDAFSGYSVLNWARYISERLRKNPDEALPYLRRMVNTEIGMDSAEVYVNKFHSYAFQIPTLKKVRKEIANLESNRTELDAFDAMLDFLERGFRTG